MGWAKYDEDIREVVEERRMVKGEYFYGTRNYDSYIKAESKISSYGSYKKETRVVKRQYHRAAENVR